jgi:hypothetical protein
MPSRKTELSQRIADRLSRPVAPIEQQIAESLTESGVFEAELSAEELAVIMRKLLYMLVAEQKVAGVEVPIVHNVSKMEIDIANSEAEIACEVHIHSPLVGFIQFSYTLENADEDEDEGRLQLKDNALAVKEVTRPMDMAAKLALRIMNVRAIALRELSDLGALIRRTLPEQLQEHGFEGQIDEVLMILQDDVLVVRLTVAES